jgi:predicted ATPase
MITHIRMKNFKSWKDSGKVELAPLTGFFGTNSSGKSSLLQMLLLIKQTAARSDPEEVIFFGDENSLVNLGNFREVIHNHESEAALELEFGCKTQDPFTIEVSHQDRYGSSRKFPLDIDGFTFDTVIHENSGHLSVKHFSYIVGPDPIQQIKYENGILYGHPRPPESLNLSAVNVYSASVVFQMPSFIHDEQGFETDQSLRPLFSAFEELFSHVYYLGPTRIHPQRHYHWERTHPKEIDLWGNKAVDALLSGRVQQLTTAYNGKKVSIEERISKWLQKLKLAHSFSLVPKGSLDDNNYEVRFQKSQGSTEVTLADMGHGVADLFPLLVHCCYVPQGSTLILEQPGVHLHPMAQAQLADLFLEVIAERNLQILVESHSEHLLTRLQRRIAEKQIDQDDIALYFCRNIDGESTKDRLEVTESGDIKNWPENFFGDVMGDMFAMTDKQVERMTDQDPEG